MHAQVVVASGFLCLLAACTSGGDDSKPTPATSEPATSEQSPSDEQPPSAGPAYVGAWRDGTRDAIGRTAEWTNKVEVADVDGDGDPDLLFANGGNYDGPGEPVASRVFRNSGAGVFTEITREVFGATKGFVRVLKVADLDGDGLQDIVMGATFQSQSRVFLGEPGGGWTDGTAAKLPTTLLSVGDLEPGDVDGDGDLDLVLADWGKGSPMRNQGGRVRLWLNDGEGRFNDVTDARMPRTRVEFSWDLELVDVDNDWDLDVATSCKMCPTSRLYLNDGDGSFTDVSAKGMPASANNYDFAPLDLDGDGYLDLLTINDGDATSQGLGERALRNDGHGGFVDATEEWWPRESNTGWDDNIVVGLDVESDGDADFVVGSLDGPDRLLVNDGTGRLTLADDVFDGTPSRGTLGMAIADLDGDGRPDVVEGQGEAVGFEDERVWFGTEVLAPDTAPPVVRAALVDGTVLARVHDNRTTNQDYEWRSVVVRWADGRRPLEWYGEHLFRAEVPAAARELQVCATDAAGNRTCDKVG